MKDTYRWILIYAPLFLTGVLVDFLLLQALKKRGLKFNYTMTDMLVLLLLFSWVLWLMTTELQLTHYFYAPQLGIHVVTVLSLGTLFGFFGGRCVAILKNKQEDSRWIILMGVEVGIGVLVMILMGWLVVYDKYLR